MPRKAFLDRLTRIEVQLPESVKSAVDLELFSEVEGKVPFGKRSHLIVGLLREWLRTRGIKSSAGWEIIPLEVLSSRMFLAFNMNTRNSKAFFSEHEARTFVDQKGIDQ